MVPLTSDIKILDLTWAFKFKRYAGVSIGKFKARFCCTEDQQVRCIEYLDTFAPVIWWTTVWILLIAWEILGLDTKLVYKLLLSYMLQLQKMFMFLWQDNNYFMGCGNPQEKNLWTHKRESVKSWIYSIRSKFLFYFRKCDLNALLQSQWNRYDIVLEKLRQLKMEFN